MQKKAEEERVKGEIEKATTIKANLESEITDIETAKNIAIKARDEALTARDAALENKRVAESLRDKAIAEQEMAEKARSVAEEAMKKREKEIGELIKSMEELLMMKKGQVEAAFTDEGQKEAEE